MVGVSDQGGREAIAALVARESRRQWEDGANRRKFAYVGNKGDASLEEAFTLARAKKDVNSAKEQNFNTTAVFHRAQTARRDLKLR